MSEIDLTGLAVFVRIVEEGSLSAAGRSLGLPKATISRTLVQLEDALGAPLLTRSTRSLSLTDAGTRLFERVRPLVHEARQAAFELKAAHAQPSGLLRVAAPVAYGNAFVVPRLIAFQKAHPAVRIELHLDDTRVNMVAEGFDLAVRMGAIDDSELVCRKIADIPMVVVATPAWVSENGNPESPLQLEGRPAVVTRPDMTHWTLGQTKVRVSWAMSTGSMPVTREAVLAGLGMGLVPQFLVAEDLAQGALVQLLPDHVSPATVATALYARSSSRSASVRALLDFLVAGQLD